MEKTDFLIQLAEIVNYDKADKLDRLIDLAQLYAKTHKITYNCAFTYLYKTYKELNNGKSIF